MVEAELFEQSHKALSCISQQENAWREGEEIDQPVVVEFLMELFKGSFYILQENGKKKRQNMMILKWDI